jgi:hypothetical protein
MKRKRLWLMFRTLLAASAMLTIIFITGMYRDNGAWLIIAVIIACIVLSITLTAYLIRQDNKNKYA